MKRARYGIKFRPPNATVALAGDLHRWPKNTNRDGWLIDPYTGEVKEFGSTIQASRYGDLSFRCHYGVHGYAIFDVLNLDG